MESWRVSDSCHPEEEQAADPHQSEKLDTDLHKIDKADPNPL